MLKQVTFELSQMKTEIMLAINKQITFFVNISDSILKMLMIDCIEFQMAWTQIEKGSYFKSIVLQGIFRDQTAKQDR